MEVVDFCKLMKDHFQLLNERSEYSAKYLRLIGPPYKPEDPTCKSTDLPTHGVNFTLIAPKIILRALSKFEITEEAFKEAYNAPPPAGPTRIK